MASEGLKEMLALWDKMTAGKDFALNPDRKHVGMVYAGLMANKKTYGMMLCPCRLRDGTKATDLSLLCPCKFKEQAVWESEGRCWCGLFVKHQNKT